MICFFFSSRRRHTRLQGDWSSDVCSSDLANVLGKVGKGLRIALTVLDFGRTTFGASCTGAAKTCLRLTIKHAKSRVQFKQTLSEFELVKKKIAYMAAHAFAMEATTTQCAAFI